MSTPETEVDKLLNHDVKAQIVNITGFCQEIESIIGEINSVYSSNTNSDRLEVLLHEDLLPCAEFLSLSAKKLADLNRDISGQSAQGKE